MNSIPVSNVRNFFIAGHTSSGKTTLVDALLFKLGACERLGSVVAGSSNSDYTDEEKSRKITLFAKPFSGIYKDPKGGKTELVFIDTPGYMDFVGQVIAASHAAETCLIAVDAVAGVQVGTRRAWKIAEKEGRSRAIVITGLDKENADFSKVLESLQSSFGSSCRPVVLPLPEHAGVVDVLSEKPAPAAMADQVAAARQGLLELASELDDALIEKFLMGETLTDDEVSRGLKAAVLKGSLVPVFACMPLKDSGVVELLDGVSRLFPAPDSVVVKDSDDKPIAAAAEAPFVGLVWRTVNDPYVGQISFVRVCGGTIKSDSEVFNATKGQKERIGALLLLNGRQQTPVTEAKAGDIVAIPKLKATSVNNTLCAVGHKVLCKPIVFPKPVAFQSVWAKTQADEDKLGVALARVVDDDPTVHVTRNTETHETILGGLGDVQLDVVVGLMKSRSHVEVTLNTPKVPYRETVTAMGEGHHKHKKQSGGRGQYGEVYLRVEPLRGEPGEWFVDAVVGGVIPHNFIPAVHKGVVEGMLSGVVAGYPVTGIKVSVYDGSYHDVDSSEISFKIAGSRALKDGLSKAKPVLLEPIMTVRVVVPDHCMGDINGDLNHKRGRILGMGLEDGLQVITAEVPQSELFRYAAELRSVTGGQGTFEMEFSRYDVVPANVAQKIIAASDRKKDVEE